jgi:hypothetical protein
MGAGKQSYNEPVGLPIFEKLMPDGQTGKLSESQLEQTKGE